MRPLSIVMSVVSFLALIAAVGAGMLAMLPARGGERILTFASVCMWSALALGVAALALAAVHLARARARETSSIVAVVLGSCATLASGGVAAGVSLLEAAGKNAERSAKSDVDRRARPVDTTVAAQPISAEELIASWKRDPARTDARYGGKALAVTVTISIVSFLDGSSRCAYPAGGGDVHFCLAAAQQDVSGPVLLVCRYHGTLNHYADKRPSGNELVLEGCLAR